METSRHTTAFESKLQHAPWNVFVVYSFRKQVAQSFIVLQQQNEEANVHFSFVIDILAVVFITSCYHGNWKLNKSWHLGHNVKFDFPIWLSRTQSVIAIFLKAMWYRTNVDNLQGNEANIGVLETECNCLGSQHLGNTMQAIRSNFLAKFSLFHKSKETISCHCFGGGCCQAVPVNLLYVTVTHKLTHKCHKKLKKIKNR